MTSETRETILEALKREDAKNTIQGIADAAGLSYNQVYRAVNEMAESGQVTKHGTTETGAALWELSDMDDDVLDDAITVKSFPLDQPIGLGTHLKVVGLALEESGSIEVELEDDEHERRLRAVLIEH